MASLSTSANVGAQWVSALGALFFAAAVDWKLTGNQAFDGSTGNPQPAIDPEDRQRQVSTLY